MLNPFTAILSLSSSTSEPAKNLTYIDGVNNSTIGAALNVWVRNGTRNDTAPLLGGLLFEDISQSGDGGIYGELIRNRAFQGSGIHLAHLPEIPGRSIVDAENPTVPFGPVLDGWSGIGDVRLSLDYLHPLSDALQVALQVDVLNNATGKVGIQNDGWWGIDVSSGTYDASFYATPNGARFKRQLNAFEVSLRSALTDDVWCSQSISVDDRLHPYHYSYFSTSLPCGAKAPNINNTFAITFDAKEAAGQTLYFDLISLFPETYKGRKNGLRKDLAEGLADMKPKFLRFPGGNNLEGYSVQRRWKWWKTIGDLKDRPGRPGDWTYYNTDGLGLLEYLIWCEDMEMEPLLAVYAGYSLDIYNYDIAGNGHNEAPQWAMPGVLQEALDELEYCMGSVNTYWGRQRALHGHPEPFDIKMIEIGNEDFFAYEYPRRAQFMYEGLKARYPDITYIFSALNETSAFNLTIPPGGIWDNHVYNTAGALIKNFNFMNHFQDSPSQREVYVSLMEYHASFVGVHGKLNVHPRMGAAVAEAVYAIGGERNPNVYKLSCFAPLIQNLNAYRGTPYDILFNSDPTETVLSASYYQQKLFNTYPGTQTLPVTESRGGLNPLFWVASIQEPESEIYLKIVNAGNTTQPLNVTFDVPFESVNGTILASPEDDMFEYNYIKHHPIVPKPIEGLESESMSMGYKVRRDSLSWTVPPFSIAVLQFNLADRTASDFSRLNEELPKNEDWEVWYGAQQPIGG